MSEKTNVAVIVPAYNEEKRIGSVLEVLKHTDVLDELIVVNDGSADATSEVARSYPEVRVVDLKSNKGKGAAMQAGLEKTKADVITFIDADLVGITPEHIESLIKPLLDDDGLMMTVGVFKGGRFSTDLAQAIVPNISGQRAVRREFFNSLGELSDKGFGVEIAMTKHAKKNGYKVKEVPLPEASQVMKEEKMGFIPGLRKRIRMYADIAKQLVSRSAKYNQDKTKINPG